MSGAVTLTIAAVHDPPSVWVDDSYNATAAALGLSQNAAFSGFNIDLFAEVFARVLADPSMRSYANAGLNYTYIAAASYSDLITRVRTGGAAASAASVSILASRVSAGVRYLAPTDASGLTMITRLVPTETGPLDTLFHPFSGNLWAAAGVAVLVAILSIWLSDRWSPFGDHASQEPLERRKINLTNSAFAGVSAAFGREAPAVRSMSSHIAVAALYLLSFFLLKSHVATLTAIFFVRANVPLVSSWQALASMPSSARLGILSNSSWVTALVNHPDPIVSGAAPRMREFTNDADAIAALRAGEIVAYARGLTTLLYDALEPPCDLYVVEPPVTQTLTAMIYFAGAISGVWEPVLRRAYGSIVADGTLNALSTEYFSPTGSCADAPAQDVSAHAVSVADLAGTLLIWFILFASGWMLLGFEAVVHKFRRRPTCRRLHKVLGGFGERAPPSGDLPEPRRDVDVRHNLNGMPKLPADHAGPG